jgi:DNA mismatch repair protein MutS
MQADKTTLNDLSIFNIEEELSVFYHLNFTQTNEGREHLRMILSKPLSDIPSIIDVQQSIQQLQKVANQWPITITNGTIMVLERFYDTPVNSYPSNPSAVSSFFYKLVSGPDYSITKYSAEHFISFVKGMQQVVDLLHKPTSKQLQVAVGRIELLLKKPMVQEALERNKQDKLTPTEILRYGNFMRSQFKHEIYEMISIYSKLDAYLSLAHASIKYGFTFPEFRESALPFIEANELYHLLLNIPVSYNVTLNKEQNFLFLTGANMAGKSTFIKAVGVSVYLAHLGLGVPAKSMKLSLFDGLLSNIQVADNIIKGESYFFNEVQRIKSTIEKISDGKKWLILIDELFKGTNVQDAMKCSTTVIEGLHKMNNALFILSTHLYEIGESLKQYPNIQFRYFETSVADEQLVFSYHLKEGISNDRLGYLILKKEGVVKMLEKL